MLFATLLALAAAALHATWNLLLKTTEERDLAALGQFAAGGLMFVPVLVVLGFPDRAAWPNLVGTSVVHVAYVTGLTRAYRHTDFSLAYPMARGVGASVAAVGGSLLLDDPLSVASWAALAVAVAGLGSLADRSVTSPSLGWALLTGLSIGVYTIIDTSGARKTEHAFSYGIMATLGPAIAIGASVALRRRVGAFAASLRRSWKRYLFTGACVTLAYALVLVAVRHAPIGYVATLRESSVVIGAWAGWILLGERLGRRRMASSVVVAAGLAALVAWS